LPRFNNLAELDFYVVDIPAHLAATWEQNEIELPSDVDLENEAMIIYGIELIIQDSATVFTTAVPAIMPFNFHLIQPANEQDLETCFMSKVVTYGHVVNTIPTFNEGHVSPFVPIIVLTGFYESCTTVQDAITANDLAFRIWYDDVPLTRDKMATLVNILRGEQV